MRVLRSAIHAISSVFGCQHDRLSRPFTIQHQSYMVCLDCGHKVFYSMQEMRKLSRREIRHLQVFTTASGKAVAAAHAHGVADDPTLAA